MTPPEREPIAPACAAVVSSGSLGVLPVAVVAKVRVPPDAAPPAPTIGVIGPYGERNDCYQHQSQPDHDSSLSKVRTTLCPW